MVFQKLQVTFHKVWRLHSTSLGLGNTSGYERSSECLHLQIHLSVGFVSMGVPGIGPLRG